MDNTNATLVNKYLTEEFQHTCNINGIKSVPLQLQTKPFYCSK